jgi:hypothetical protein
MGTEAPALEQHVVLTGADGELRTEREAVDAMLAAIGKRGRGVIHFHGGLVSEERGLATAKSLLPVYTGAGAYPVFFVWRSGLTEIATGTLLKDIADEAVFKQLLKRLLRFAAGKVAADVGTKSVGGTAMPSEMRTDEELRKRDTGEEPFADLEPADEPAALTPADEQTLELELGTDYELQAALRTALSQDATAQEARTKGLQPAVDAEARPTMMDPAALEELREGAPGEAAKGLVSTTALVAKAVRVLTRVIMRFRSHRDHGLYPTVVEEILREFYLATAGAAVWQAMKKETLDTFAPGQASRGGAYFLSRLGELLRSEPRPQITLVGHSTGAVFINNLMEAVEARRKDPGEPFPADFRFRHVIFLAPACTFTDFARVVPRWEDLWDDFRMFTMTDDAERHDALVPVVYPRSLLYFVSGVLERDAEGKGETAKPIVGLARYYEATLTGAPEEVEEVRRYVDGADRVVWSPADGGPGLSSGALSHGAFDEDEQVRASLRAIIAGEKGP